MFLKVIHNIYIFGVTIACFGAYLWMYLIDYLAKDLLFFFTFWNQAIITLYFTIASYNKIQSFQSKKTISLSTFYSIAFSTSIFTVASFWFLYFQNPQLVVVDDYETRIPMILNHILHSFPIFYLFFELLFFPNYLRKKSLLKFDLISILLISSSYGSLSVLSKFWNLPTYPFVKALPFPYLIITASSGSFAGVIFVLFSRLILNMSSRLFLKMRNISDKKVD
ncbi:androgen-induced protein [Anaeramoeba ignava]|uniref:Androgen-induced protein n=1 Tax=Anaeramoeba ignava TaxID=1746090 RepID=A0A9Q0LFP7_ANAIG|nr:androgen-induced protein [Anaeramoeba ignava]